MFEPIEWTIPEEWVKDKDLAERVKSRKVIRKRSGVKEEVTQGRKKVKTTQGSLHGDMKEREEEHRLDLCHRNGEVHKEKNNVKEENLIKEETNIKQEETIKTGKDEVLNKEEENSVTKSEQENGIKTENEVKEEGKVERSEDKIIKAEDEVLNKEKENGAVKSDRKDGINNEVKEEEDKLERSEVFTNGNSIHSAVQEEGDSGVTKESWSNENQNDPDT